MPTRITVITIITMPTMRAYSRELELAAVGITSNSVCAADL